MRWHLHWNWRLTSLMRTSPHSSRSSRIAIQRGRSVRKNFWISLARTMSSAQTPSSGFKQNFELKWLCIFWFYSYIVILSLHDNMMSAKLIFACLGLISILFVIYFQGFWRGRERLVRLSRVHPRHELHTSYKPRGQTKASLYLFFWLLRLEP